MWAENIFGNSFSENIMYLFLGAGLQKIHMVL